MTSILPSVVIFKLKKNNLEAKIILLASQGFENCVTKQINTMFHSLGVNDQPRMTVAPKYCMCSVYIKKQFLCLSVYSTKKKWGHGSGERVQISFLSPGILGAQKLGVPLSLSQLNTSSCSVTVSIFNTFHNKFWSILV